MKLFVIICTIGRPAILHDTVESILRQTYPVQELIIASPARENVEERTAQLPGVRFVQTRLGLPAQRNEALDQVDPQSDLIAFIDDDMELCSTYFAAMVRVFEQNQNTVIASGILLHDGGIDRPIDRVNALSLCANHETTKTIGKNIQTLPRKYGYGCNMIVNAKLAGKVRFDERLPLYAWLEDSDYSFRCTQGKLGAITCTDAVAVHLGWKGGRVAGVRLGFSQMVNPIYLWKKARVFSFPFLVKHYWLRCLAGNILGVLSGNVEEDRLGRLRGNLKGIQHLVSGKCDPSYAKDIA